MKKLITAFNLILLYSGIMQVSYSQIQVVPDEKKDGNYRFVDLKLHRGLHVYVGDSLENEDLMHGYQSIEVRYAWQSTGEYSWQKKYAYPSYGMGLYYGDPGNPDIFGSPAAFFGFFGFPLSHHKKHMLNIEMALGVTFNLKSFDTLENNQNDAIGSQIAAYINLNLGGSLMVNREIDFIYGFDITHMSNARTFTPNNGLNMVGINAGARYHFNCHQRNIDNSFHPQRVLEARPVLTDYQTSARLKQNFIMFYQAFGTVQNTADEGTNKHYLTSSSVLQYQHKFTEKNALVGGIDLFYDGSVTNDTSITDAYISHDRAYFPAWHVGYEFMFWRMSVLFHSGSYLNQTGFDYKGNFFLRFGIKYEFPKLFYAQVGFKTFDRPTSDFLELGMGIKFLGWTKKNK